VETTKQRGASAEDRATAALEAAGYSIVARNWTCVVGELDIVARDGEVLVFVEVRSRADAAHGHAAEMVTPGKRRKVARVAQMYLGLERPRFAECRFDVVAITGDELAVVRDAWRLGRG
jgi:putative endonuclease